VFGSAKLLRKCDEGLDIRFATRVLCFLIAWLSFGALDFSIVMQELGSKERRGRHLLGLAILITLVGDALVIALKAGRLGFTSSIGSVLRWLITVLLFCALWRGQRWARRLLVASMGVGFAFVILSLFRTLQPLAMIVAIQLGISLQLLSVSPSVSAFLKSQRTQYDEHG
jgi:hypothetical protein